jgi:hypothetical protein
LPFSAIIVHQNGEIIGKGTNQVAKFINCKLVGNAASEEINTFLIIDEQYMSLYLLQTNIAKLSY